MFALWPSRTIVGLIRLYQKYLSVLTPPRCRFEPSCSQYVLEAVMAYGVPRGFWMGFRRLLRCHPFHAAGFDPVPVVPVRTRSH